MNFINNKEQVAGGKGDLKQRSYRFALEIIRLMEKLPKDMASIVMAKQVLRSATSIGANIIEAKSASSRKDFINFYNYALKSANETKFWLLLLQDAGKANVADAQPIIQESYELANMLAASIITFKNK